MLVGTGVLLSNELMLLIMYRSTCSIGRSITVGTMSARKNSAVAAAPLLLLSSIPVPVVDEFSPLVLLVIVDDDDEEVAGAAGLVSTEKNAVDTKVTSSAA